MSNNTVYFFCSFVRSFVHSIDLLLFVIRLRSIVLLVAVVVKVEVVVAVVVVVAVAVVLFLFSWCVCVCVSKPFTLSIFTLRATVVHFFPLLLLLLLLLQLISFPEFSDQ